MKTRSRVHVLTGDEGITERGWGAGSEVEVQQEWRPSKGPSRLKVKKKSAIRV